MANQATSRSPCPEARRGFTLVELLVVIGIIAVLIALLLPALNQSRRAANTAKCLSNCHQMFLAFQMYAVNNAGYLPPTSDGNQPFIVNGVSTLTAVRWWGGAYGPTATSPSITTGTPYAPASPLDPYWGDATPGGCPEFTDQETTLRPGYGTCDYAYNDYAGGRSGTGALVGLKLSQFQNSQTKALVWDSGRIGTGGGTTVGFGGVDRTPWGYPTTGNPNNGMPDPNFHGRHGTGVGNVAWCDGHASSIQPYYFNYPALGYAGMETSKLKANHVGMIDTDGNILTDDNYAPTY
jgi:prepilin-type N-terminal cleavage/methylation domain-containing protein/prepilin-type processing-associated H-X9-DG protein